MSESIPGERPTDSGYEERDLDPRKIALFAAGGAVVLLFAAALAFWMVQSATRRDTALQSPLKPAQARERVAQPRLQVRGFNELREMRGAEETILNSYAWIDRERGIVRIPVERAMEILAAQEKKTGNRQQATGNRRAKEGVGQ